MNTRSPNSDSPGVIVSLQLGRSRTPRNPAGNKEPAQQAAHWIHLDRHAEPAVDWLRNESGLDAQTVNELAASSTRPRCTIHGDGILLVLRGVNLNPGASPEDMISIRLWADPTQLISLQGERLLAVQTIIDEFEAGRGPQTVGELVLEIAAGLTQRMRPVIEEITEAFDDMQDRVIDPERTIERAELARLRRQVISLHRFILPQVQALTILLDSRTPLLDAKRLRVLKDICNRVTRLIEDLEAARNHGEVIQDELQNQLSEKLAERTHTVTVLAAVFLPITLVSGLFGMNVGGIPLSNHGWGFAGVCLGLVLAGIIFYFLLRKLKIV